MRRGLALLVLAVLAAGCSGSGDEPVALPTLTATPSPTATVAPVPPEATANTSQSLDAFVRFYFQQLNVAFSTSNGALVRRYSDPACGTCNNYAKAMDDNPHQVIEGDSFADVQVAVPPINPSGTLVDVFFRIPDRKLVDQTGKVVKSLPGKEHVYFVLNVIRVSDHWSVRGIKFGQQQGAAS